MLATLVIKITLPLSLLLSVRDVVVSATVSINKFPVKVTAPVKPLTDCTGARPIRLVAVTFFVVAVPATSSTMGKMSAPAGVGRSVSSVIFLFMMI